VYWLQISVAPIYLVDKVGRPITKERVHEQLAIPDFCSPSGRLRHVTRAGEPGERVCVNVRSINSFDAIDDKHVYIRANVNDHYLFTMWGGCYGLRNAQSIAVKDTFSRVCSNSFGEIIYRDLGRRLESCKIQTIEPVAGREDAEGLVKDRREAAQEKRAEEESKQ
jgi:hypothetical protein